MSMTAKQAWERAIECMLTELSVKEVEAYGDERYREGVEAMRDAAHPLMRWPEDHIGLDNIAFRLLKGAPK